LSGPERAIASELAVLVAGLTGRLLAPSAGHVALLVSVAAGRAATRTRLRRGFAALAPGLASFFGVELVRRALRVRSASALGRDLALLLRIHRSATPVAGAAALLAATRLLVLVVCHGHLLLNQVLRPPDDFEPLFLLSLPEREDEDFEPEDRSLPPALLPVPRWSVCWFLPDGLLFCIVWLLRNCTNVPKQDAESLVTTRTRLRAMP